jgi:hypothetical protein
LAAALRNERLAAPAATEDNSDATDLAAIDSAPPSETDMLCINIHRLRDPMMQAKAANSPGQPGLKPEARARGANGQSKASNPKASRSSSEAKSGKPHRADAAKPTHAKAAVRTSARHALHALPRNGGAA